jgi:dihydrofolate synthase/folylpolyglutamate synthase
MRRSRKQGSKASPAAQRTGPREAGSRAARARALEWLDGRINFERIAPSGAPFGLARMRRLLAAIGSPQDRVPVVHVAGTKGKGSTVAMLAAILEESGYRVGRYMSPHVHAVEERICVAGRPISAADLARAFADVVPAVEALDAAAARRGGRGPTWFEVVTAVAMLHFARSGVDVAVLETGLGGRLDATNVSRPIVSVITSISLDHMALLGPTVGRIAGEKAGIIKRGCPVVSGAVHPAARRVIAATAARRRAALIQLGRDFHVRHVPPVSEAETLAAGWVEVSEGPQSPPVRYRLGMAGSHQAENAALAVIAARRLDALGHRVPQAAIARGLARVRLPARIEVVSRRPLVIVDAAHNVASMQSLVDTLAAALARHSPRVLMFAASGDKQIEKMLALAKGSFDHVVVTRYSTNPRAAPIERLVAACRKAGLPKPLTADSPRAALAVAQSLATNTGIVCVAGSFFLASEISGGSRPG